jgi:hypothetical protein
MYSLLRGKSAASVFLSTVNYCTPFALRNTEVVLSTKQNQRGEEENKQGDMNANTNARDN